MPRLTLDPGARRFLLDGRPCFLLADTLWSAFHRPTEPEWRSYLQLRQRQGFTAVNISILPIAGDRTVGGDQVEPFAAGPDLDRLNEAYFTRARHFTELAIAHGLVPILVVLWHDYVPGPPDAPGPKDWVLSEEQTAGYLDRVVATFADLDVVLVISGDDWFTAPEAIRRYTATARRLRAQAPQRLLTLHTAPLVSWPAELADGELIDFYTYQSGHDTGWDTRCHQEAARLRALPVPRPIVALEPCYEGHGLDGGVTRRTAADVRLASWSSVLAGAGAGLGYGAHGAWGWHRTGDPFNGERFSGTPFPVDVALRFDGAWDVAFLRHLVEDYELYDLTERQGWLVEDRSGARVGAQNGPDRVAVFVPQPFAVTLDTDLSGWTVTAWNLRRRDRERIAVTVDAGRTRIEQPGFLADALVLFSR